MSSQTPSGGASLYERGGNLLAETNGSVPAGTTREYIWLPDVESRRITAPVRHSTGCWQLVADVSASPVHAEQVRGFRQFLLRGIEKAGTERAIMCTAHNIVKLAKAA